MHGEEGEYNHLYSLCEVDLLARHRHDMSEKTKVRVSMLLQIGFIQKCSRILAILVCAAYLSGCSFFGGSSQNFAVSSDPMGATVRINGQQVGVTPLQYQVSRRGDLLIEVEKTGYRSQFRQTSRKLSSLGIADVIGGAFLLLPLIGLVAPGAWEQDPAAMGFSLEPAAASSTSTPAP
ncbi:MAG: PEGA domain-containing protein [Nitrospira sp.]|nr:PEGA domain-containing protein [Nitrospira sp.]